VKTSAATRVVRLLLIAIAMIYSVMLLIPQFQPGGFRPDFAVFWTAAQLVPAHIDQLYDAQAMTAAQSWLTSSVNGLRPFAYPPTALLLFRPFGVIPFPAAFLLWTFISLAAFAAAARRFVAHKALALSLISPPVALALATGQTSLLSAGAMMGAISILERRPVLAGVILGAATALKPQTLILAPLVLIVAQQWRALLAWGVSGLALVLATVILWGKQVWLDWLSSLSGFSAIVSRLGLDTEGVTPLSFAKSAGLAGWPALAIQIAAIIAGCVLVIWAFRRPDRTTRLVALAAGSLLCAPYALMYDLSVLMPIAAALLLSGRATGLFAGFALTGLAGVGALPVVIASTLTEGGARRTGTPT
jgi:Glycosyltransferase family 87